MYIVIQSHSRDRNDFSYFLTHDGTVAECSSRFAGVSFQDFMQKMAIELASLEFKFEEQYFIDFTKHPNMPDDRVLDKTRFFIKLIRSGSENSIHCYEYRKQISKILKLVPDNLIEQRVTPTVLNLAKLLYSMSLVHKYSDQIGVSGLPQTVKSYFFDVLPDEVLKAANVARTEDNLTELISCAEKHISDSEVNHPYNVKTNLKAFTDKG